MRKFLCIIFIMVLSTSYGQDIPATREARIRAVENNLSPNIIYGDTVPSLSLEKQMEAMGIVGLSVAVIRNYQVDWVKGYGWADRERQIKVDTNTAFQSASISKSFNALALLKLAQEGKIDLETDINDYLVSWKFPYDSISRGRKIKVANLLSHTAGLSIHGFPGYTTRATIPGLPAILDGKIPANTKAVRSLFEPNKRFQYSGGGTTISQLILEDLTKDNYADFLQKEVLDKLGMRNSSFRQPADTNRISPATAYTGGKPVRGRYHVYPEQGAAGLWTNPADLSKYIIETQLAYEGRSSKVLNQEWTKKRLTPYVDSVSALGVFMVKKGKNTYFNHNGGNEGFVSAYYGSLEGGNGVVVMTNTDNFGIINEVLNSVARVYKWEGFFTPVLKKLYYPGTDTLTVYAGNYLLGTDTISLAVCGTRLCVWQNGQPEAGFKAIFTSPLSFEIAEAPGVSISMIFKEGRVDEFELTQNGGRMKAGRIATEN